MGNVFYRPENRNAGAKKLELLLVYPGTSWNSPRRLEILDDEIAHGIELCESSVRSPVLKLLLDFLIATRDGNICEYYQQISEKETGMIVELPFKS